MRVELTTRSGRVVLDRACFDRERGVATGRLPSGGRTIVPLDAVRRQRLLWDERHGHVGPRGARR